MDDLNSVNQLMDSTTETNHFNFVNNTRGTVMPLTEKQEIALKDFIEDKADDLFDIIILDQEAKKFIFKQLIDPALSKVTIFLDRIKSEIPKWELGENHPLVSVALKKSSKRELEDFFCFLRLNGDYCAHLTVAEGIEFSGKEIAQKVRDIFIKHLKDNLKIELSIHPEQIKQSPTETLESAQIKTISKTVAEKSTRLNEQQFDVSSLMTAQHLSEDQVSMLKFIVNDTDSKESERNKARLILVRHQQIFDASQNSKSNSNDNQNSTQNQKDTTFAKLLEEPSLSSETIELLRYKINDSSVEEDEKTKASEILKAHNLPLRDEKKSTPQKTSQERERTSTVYQALTIGHHTGTKPLVNDGDILILGHVSGTGNVTSKYGAITIKGHVSGTGNITAENNITVHGNIAGTGNIKSVSGEVVYYGTYSGVRQIITGKNGGASINNSQKSTCPTRGYVNDSDSSDDDFDAMLKIVSSTTPINSSFFFNGNKFNLNSRFRGNNVSIGSTGSIQSNTDGNVVTINNKTSIKNASFIDLMIGSFKLYVDNKGRRTVNLNVDRLNGLVAEAVVRCNDIELKPDVHGKLDLSDFRSENLQGKSNSSRK